MSNTTYGVGILGAGWVVGEYVKFVLRWNPQFITVRQLIDDGVLGELIYGEAD